MPQGGLKDRLVLTDVVGKGHTKGCVLCTCLCVWPSKKVGGLSLHTGGGKSFHSVTQRWRYRKPVSGSTEGEVGSSIVMAESEQAFVL